MSEVERLGTITAPSGKVLLVDMGLLGLWSHDRRPYLEPGTAPDETVERANSQVDLAIVGPDAARAGVLFDRQPWTPTRLVDIPAHGVPKVQTSFEAVLREHGLDARLEVLPERISHRARVDLALAEAAAGVVQFQGIWAVACAGVPRAGPLDVVGERRPEGAEFDGRWQHVSLVVADRPVARSDQVGHVMVDRARLMFADVDALGAWAHDEPIDGKADFLLWGRDAAAVARDLDVPYLGDAQWGWLDLEVEEAAARGTEVEEHRDREGLKLATDFRPHSHHYEVMAQVRETPAEAGTLEVGGARVCGFMTSWGDGVFPVFRDLDAEGGLVRVRVELGCERQLAVMRRLSGE